jgi:phenylacetate-coenzyme A ligase PaaK-like adenylate-forming protein
MESWLHNIVRARFEEGLIGRLPQKDYAERMNRSAIDHYHLLELQQTLHYVYQKSSFYQRLFQNAGVHPDDVSGLDDLASLPLTEQRAVAEEPYRFLCLSRAAIARVTTFVTSGTTGPQKKIFWTQADLERIIRFMAAGISTVADETDVVQICLPSGRSYSQADLLARGVEKIGAKSVLAGMELSSKEQFALIEKNHSTVLFGYTPHLFRLTRELQAECTLSKLGIKVLFLASEYLSDSMRRELQRLWDCRVHTHYGLTEMGLGVAVECSSGNGYHFNEADLFLEIINPNTGAPVSPGQEGELVFTTLNREAMPLIRYRTGDVSHLIPEPCSCGATTLLKFAPVRKRLNAIVRLGNGDELYASAFDDLLFEVPELVDYQVMLLRHSGKDRLDFRIELLAKPEGIIEKLLELLLTAPAIANNLRNGTMATPCIELVAPGTLKTASRTKKLLADQR